MTHPPLTPGSFYHIYNHGVGGRDLFVVPEDYEYFLRQYDKYILPVADTYAWTLMKNHFHLLVRIKEDVVYKYSNADRSVDAVRFEEVKWETINLSSPNLSASFGPDSVEKSKIKTPKPHLHFSHLFNAYSKYFNKRYHKTGALFERPFKRKLIEEENYLKQIILYIHNNPVHHGFCSHPIEYPWSSYLTCISVKPTKLCREPVIGWFDDIANFKAMHNGNISYKEIENWLEF